MKTHIGLQTFPHATPRKLPRGWRLDTEEPARDVDGIVGAIIIWIAILLFVLTATGVIK